MFNRLINSLRTPSDGAQVDNQQNGNPDNHDEPVPHQFDASERDRARDLIAREQERAEARFEERWHEDWDREGSIEALNEWHGWRTADALLDTVDTPTVPTFQVDSLLLADCYETLFADPTVESFVYLTGQQVGEQRWTLNRCIPVDHTKQSAGGAEGDPDSSIDTLVELDAVDHQLLGHAHNHPGTGAAGVTPSDTDLTYQQELEAGGYTAIGLVMSRDGHARFFTDSLDFAVEVYGTDVTPIDTHEDTFKIDDRARTATQRLASA